MKWREVERRLREDGWEFLRDHGHVRIYQKSEHPEISVHGEPGEEIKPGTLAQVRRKSGLDLR